MSSSGADGFEEQIGAAEQQPGSVMTIPEGLGPQVPLVAPHLFQGANIYPRETFILSARWMSFIRETEGDELVDAVLKGCTVMPWSFTKSGGGSVDESGNSVKIVLENTLTDKEIGEKMAQLFELFERAETRQISSQSKPVKFQLTEHVIFKNDVSGYVIGKGGNNLWNIKQYTGVDLLVVDDGRKQIEPKPEGFDRLIINGASSFYVHHARYQVQHLFDQAGNISTSPDIPHYPVSAPPTSDPYYAGAAAAGAVQSAGGYFGGGMVPPPPPSGHMIPPGHMLPPNSGMYASPALGPMMSAPSSLKRPRVDMGPFTSSLNGGASVLPKVGGGQPSVAVENGGGSKSSALASPVAVAVSTRPPPETVKELMGRVGEHFDAVKQQIEESLGPLLNDCSQGHIKELESKLAEKDAELAQLKKEVEVERLKLMCIGCNTEEREVLFGGCRHLLFCVFCAGKYGTCPQCGMAVGEESKITVDRAVPVAMLAHQNKGTPTKQSMKMETETPVEGEKEEEQNQQEQQNSI